MGKINVMKGLLLSMAGLLLLTGCDGNTRKAEHAAKDFLQAYYLDLDFEKALSLSTDISHASIHEQAELISLNPYAKEEIPDIIFKGIEMDRQNDGKATYAYSVNRVERTLPLRKLNGIWLVDLQKGTVESGGGEMMELSSGQQGGFAAAASGPVVYKKRKH